VTAAGAPSCTASTASTADEVQILTTVVWNADAAGGGAGRDHGLVTPQEGGSLIARVLSTSGNPVSGATVSLTGGPTSASTLTTDANGCVEFAALSGGTYTVTATASGVAESVTAPTVVPTQTSVATLTPGGPGASRQHSRPTTTGRATLPVPTRSLRGTSPHTSTRPLAPRAHWAPNTYLPTVNSGAVLNPGNYTAYAGTCAGDYSSSGYQTAAVTTNTTQAVVLPLPAMIVNVWGATPSVETDDPASSSVVYTGSGWTHATGASSQYNNTDSYGLTAGNYVKFTFTGTSIQWIGPKATNQGYANVLIDGTQFATNVKYLRPRVVSAGAVQRDWPHQCHTHDRDLRRRAGTLPAGSSAAYVSIDAFIVGTGGSGEVDDPPAARSYMQAAAGRTQWHERRIRHHRELRRDDRRQRHVHLHRHERGMDRTDVHL